MSAAVTSLRTAATPLAMTRIMPAGYCRVIACCGVTWATTRGQTIGKWLVGTRIVRADNDEVPTLARTLGLRYGTVAIEPVRRWQCSC